MNSYKLNPGIYSAIIIDRSTDDPGRNITYDVALAIGKGEVTIQNVAPQAELRWSTIDPTLDLVPFPIGTRVTVHISPNGAGSDVLIETSELPYIGECT